MPPPSRRARAPEGYEAAGYPRFSVTVDLVILAVRNARLEVLLVERGGDPFAGMWALPGGFKRPDESLEAAAARELAEETGLETPGHLAQLGAYGDPGRDPRDNVVTVAFLAAISDPPEPRAGSDAAGAAWWPTDAVLEGTLEVAFDHRDIIADAVDRLARDLETTGVATAFVGDSFTLSALRGVYEAAWGEPLDPANFQRALVDPDHAWVEPTDETPTSGPRGGRPSRRYRATRSWSAASPLRRPRRGRRD